MDKNKNIFVAISGNLIYTIYKGWQHQEGDTGIIL